MIDELNVFSEEYVNDFAKYFEPMHISKEDKEKREKTANDLWYVFLFLFAMIKDGIENGGLDYEYILFEFRNMFSDTVKQYAVLDDYLNEYVTTFSQNTMDTTWTHMNLSNPDDYWLSNDRASLLALNESNSINNYGDLKQAIKDGKTHKTWVAEIDNKTRDEHFEMNGTTIPIYEYFSFSDCSILVPHDSINGTPAQNANCRCAVVYTTQG